jgi:hypothetical protein
MIEFDPDQLGNLKAALAEIHGRVPVVPAELDDAILSEARRSFARRRKLWTLAQRVGLGLAAAAVLAIAVRAFLPSATSRVAPLQRPQLAQAADVNRDGRVDILDAFVVARSIARHEPLDPAWDVNGDGVVDQKDVDLIAHLAVRVDGGKPQ